MLKVKTPREWWENVVEWETALKFWNTAWQAWRGIRTTVWPNKRKRLKDLPVALLISVGPEGDTRLSLSLTELGRLSTFPSQPLCLCLLIRSFIEYKKALLKKIHYRPSHWSGSFGWKFSFPVPSKSNGVNGREKRSKPAGTNWRYLLSMADGCSQEVSLEFVMHDEWGQPPRRLPIRIVAWP